MAFKYQVLLCPRPKDILLVTFNHLDAIKDFICDAPGILNQVDETFRQLIEVRILSKMVEYMDRFSSSKLVLETNCCIGQCPIECKASYSSMYQAWIH